MSINDLRELSISELETKVSELKKRTYGIKILISNKSD